MQCGSFKRSLTSKSYRSLQTQSDRVSVGVRMGLTLVCVLGLFLMNKSLLYGQAQDIVLSIEPNWSTFFTGETLTFVCDISIGKDSDWYYSFRRNGLIIFSYITYNRITTTPLTQGYTGEYQCVGNLRSSPDAIIESNSIYLTISDRPQPLLTVSPSWLSPGDSVTLTCRVEPPSAGWRFFWYQAAPSLQDSYRHELLPGSTNGTEQGSYIVHGQTHTAAYACRAIRGDPEFSSLFSGPKFIWSGGSRSAASLTVSPHRLQYFSKQPLSLMCAGNSTEWRVRRVSRFGILSSCSVWGTMTGSTCNIISRGISGVYWCESETRVSNAVNITMQSGDVILVSSVHPVTEGHSVTLGCRLETEEVLHNVNFYKNNKLVLNHAREELIISEATKSDEGFYKCEGSVSPQGLSLTSPESWLSVKYAAESSLFPVLLVVGLVCGVSLIILLLLFLYCCRKSKDSRLVRSQSTNQSPATDHMTNQAETQDNAYASPHHGDSCLYETIKGSEEPGHGENNEPEDSVYSNVTMGTAAGQ